MELRGLLSHIPKSVVVLDAAVAALSATLIRDRLIPENVDVIGTIGALLIVVAFIVTIAYQSRLRRWLPRLALTAVAMLIILLLLQITVVETVGPYGPDEGRHRFLVGFSYSEQGRMWKKNQPAQSVSEYISYIGDDRIPLAWGPSYTVAAALYSLSYFGFILAVVLALGSLESAGTRTRGGAHSTRI
jgi:hypothetical protein